MELVHLLNSVAFKDSSSEAPIDTRIDHLIHKKAVLHREHNSIAVDVFETGAIFRKSTDGRTRRYSMNTFMDLGNIVTSAGNKMVELTLEIARQELDIENAIKKVFMGLFRSLAAATDNVIVDQCVLDAIRIQASEKDEFEWYSGRFSLIGLMSTPANQQLNKRKQEELVKEEKKRKSIEIVGFRFTT